MRRGRGEIIKHFQIKKQVKLAPFSFRLAAEGRRAGDEGKVWVKKLKFKRQYVIQGFIVDFYCPKLKLAIEIDGEIHKYQLKDDVERQKIIESENIKFFRIKSKEVENDLKNVLERLKRFIK